MAELRMLMCIMLYVGLVTIVVSGISGQSNFSGIGDYNNFITRYYYTNLAIDGLNFSDLKISATEGQWAISEAQGLHATELVLKNPLHWLLNEPAYYEAECRFGSVVAANKSFTESFNVTGVNFNKNDRNMFLMIDMSNIANFFGGVYQWWLVVNGNELWIQSARLNPFVGNYVWKELGDNIDTGYNNFVRNYDTGYRFPTTSYNYKITYKVDFINQYAATITLYVNNGAVFIKTIPLTHEGYNNIVSGLTVENRQTVIKTNNYDFGLKSTSQIIEGQQIDRGFDFWALFDNIFKICTFSVSSDICPLFLQFIFFGIYDIGLLYIVVCIVRGVG